MTWKIRITGLLLITFFGIFSAIYLRYYVNPLPHGIILFIAPGLSPELLSMVHDEIPEKDKQFFYNTDRISFVTSHIVNYESPSPRELLSSLACGRHIRKGVIGISEKNKPSETLLYDAQRSGRLVGIISSTHLASAGGSAFFTHSNSPFDGLEIIQNAFDNTRIDLLISKDTTPIDALNFQKKRNIAEELKSKGYQHLTNMDAFYNIMLWPPPNVFGTFDKQVSLTELVTRSIQCMQYNITGYFLIIDHHAIIREMHAGDLSQAVEQTLQLFQALRKAREYADENTTILIYCPYLFNPNAQPFDTVNFDKNLQNYVTQTNGWVIMDTENDDPLPAFIDVTKLHKIISSQL